MRRDIPFLAAAAAALVASGCGRRCDPAVLNVYWESFTDSAGRTFNCSDANSGVAAIQVFVDGQAQFIDASGASQPIACIPFPRDSPSEGVGLVDFGRGTYVVDVQGYDVNGRVAYEDQQTTVIQGDTCNLQQRVDLVPAATPTLTMSVSFNGAASCAAAGVQNFFVELFDDLGVPVAVSANGFLPCLDTPGALPFFQVADLVFGRTYTFRTLAGTTFDATAPPTNQRTLFQSCGDAVAFSTLTPSFQVDLPAAVAGQQCP